MYTPFSYVYTLQGTLWKPVWLRTPGGMLAWSVLGFSLEIRVSSGYNFRVGGVYAGNRGVRVSLAYKKTLDICTTSLQP